MPELMVLLITFTSGKTKGAIMAHLHSKAVGTSRRDHTVQQNTQRHDLKLDRFADQKHRVGELSAQLCQKVIQVEGSTKEATSWILETAKIFVRLTSRYLTSQVFACFALFYLPRVQGNRTICNLCMSREGHRRCT